MQTECASIYRVATIVYLLTAVCAGTVRAGERVRAVVPLTVHSADPKLLYDSVRLNVGVAEVNWKVHWNSGPREQMLVWRYTRTGGFAPVSVESTMRIEFDRRSAELWMTRARALLVSEAQKAARAAGVRVIVVDRQHLSRRLVERNLGTVGITGDDPTRRRPQAKCDDEHEPPEHGPADRSAASAAVAWRALVRWRDIRCRAREVVGPPDRATHEPGVQVKEGGRGRRTQGGPQPVVAAPVPASARALRTARRHP